MLISARALRGDSSLCVRLTHPCTHLSPEDGAWDPPGSAEQLLWAAWGGPGSRGRVMRVMRAPRLGCRRGPSSPGALGAWAQDRSSRLPVPSVPYRGARGYCRHRRDSCVTWGWPDRPPRLHVIVRPTCVGCPEFRTRLGLGCDGPAARLPCGRMHWCPDVPAWVRAATLGAPVRTRAGTSRRLPGGAVTSRPGAAVRRSGATRPRDLRRHVLTHVFPGSSSPVTRALDRS